MQRIQIDNSLVSKAKRPNKHKNIIKFIRDQGNENESNVKLLDTYHSGKNKHNIAKLPLIKGGTI